MNEEVTIDPERALPTTPGVYPGEAARVFNPALKDLRGQRSLSFVLNSRRQVHRLSVIGLTTHRSKVPSRRNLTPSCRPQH